MLDLAHIQNTIKYRNKLQLRLQHYYKHYGSFCRLQQLERRYSQGKSPTRHRILGSSEKQESAVEYLQLFNIRFRMSFVRAPNVAEGQHETNVNQTF